MKLRNTCQWHYLAILWLYIASTSQATLLVVSEGFRAEGTFSYQRTYDGKAAMPERGEFSVNVVDGKYRIEAGVIGLTNATLTVTHDGRDTTALLRTTAYTLTGVPIGPAEVADIHEGSFPTEARTLHQILWLALASSGSFNEEGQPRDGSLPFEGQPPDATVTTTASLFAGKDKLPRKVEFTALVDPTEEDSPTYVWRLYETLQTTNQNHRTFPLQFRFSQHSPPLNEEAASEPNQVWEFSITNLAKANFKDDFRPTFTQNQITINDHRFAGRSGGEPVYYTIHDKAWPDRDSSFVRSRVRTAFLEGLMERPRDFAGLLSALGAGVLLIIGLVIFRIFGKRE